jgi:hypothetical protein
VDTAQYKIFWNPAIIFWRHPKSYGLNVANLTFFSFKYGDFVPFLLKKSSVGLVVPPFVFGHQMGKFRPKGATHSLAGTHQGLSNDFKSTTMVLR